MIGTPSAATARAAPERCASWALVLWRSSTRGSRASPSGAGLAEDAARTTAPITAVPPHHERVLISTSGRRDHRWAARRPGAGCAATRPRSPRSLQPELDGEEHPHGDGLLAAPPRLEFPAAHGVGGCLVEIRVSGALLDDHVADLTVDEHVD